MKGGSLPLLGLGTVLTILGALNLVWTGDDIQAASFGFAALVLWSAGGLWALRSQRETIRRGAPPPNDEPQTIPTASLGAVGAAVSVASILFGFAFGRFFVFFGAGLLLASFGLLAIEVAGERRTRQNWREGRHR